MTESRLLGSDNKQWRRLSDGSTWPVMEHDPDLDAVEWRLRYASDHLTREDLLYAASVMSAYRHLVYEASQKRVALVRRELSEPLS
ncbi:hypothetical protein [Nocardia flavorosea]|uniref:Uncharacterized protein n=1 Tax=Nocardia flavorosea TaxID=53429 RepID=A0A846YMY4_9NOCA|nr:hypothetical protein [Nocardia flavorosea]NKY60405.1 hypothetical protein [Nocardia flavorosea]